MPRCESRPGGSTAQPARTTQDSGAVLAGSRERLLPGHAGHFPPCTEDARAPGGLGLQPCSSQTAGLLGNLPRALGSDGSGLVPAARVQLLAVGRGPAGSVRAVARCADPLRSTPGEGAHL